MVPASSCQALGRGAAVERPAWRGGDSQEHLGVAPGGEPGGGGEVDDACHVIHLVRDLLLLS